MEAILISTTATIIYILICKAVKRKQIQPMPEPAPVVKETDDLQSIYDLQIDTLTALIKHLDQVYKDATTDKAKAAALRQQIVAQNKLITILRKKA